MARVATSAPFVSVPAAASPAATTPTTTPGRLAVVVPVTVSFLAGAVTAVLLTGHVQTAVPGLSFPSVQPLVQTAGLQEVPAAKQTTKKRTHADQKQGLKRLVQVRNSPVPCL